jgi:amino acid adenylation domain-containing protein
MTTVEVLTKFRRLGIKLWLEGERLRYSAQVGVLTPELSAELAASKTQIVQFLRTARSSETRTPPPLVPKARDRELPLSFAQQRLWFLDQLEPDSPLYNIPYAVQLNGAVDFLALERSVNQLVLRHESLRTCFPSNDGQPTQLIQPSQQFTLLLEDLTLLRHELRGAELRRLLDEEARRPFDLAAGPLFRLRLLKLSEEEHVLAVTMHHIISDGWSMGVLTRELGALYTACVQDKPSPLPKLPVQYADYAAWQREWLQGEVLEEQLSYWRWQLAGAPPLLELPADKARPPVQSHRGSRVSMQLDAETTRSLKALSYKHNTTLFITAMVAFQALLSRWSGETDVVVGTVVAGRNKAETEGIIGFLVNTLAIRTDLSGDPTVAELLARTTEVCLGAYAHQELPFEKLVEELGLERDLSRAPLVQVMLVLQNTPEELLEMPSLRLSQVTRAGGVGLTGSAKFDLVLTLNEIGNAIEGTLDYNLDLFEQETVRRMARQLERVLRTLGEAEDCRLSELPLLGQEERERLLTGWTRKTPEFACARNLAESFERVAQRTPDAVAVTFEGEEVSYGELNRRSNRLAHHLMDHGIEAEVRVGLFLERSVEMVVAILATLKAGAAYVPLEVTLPPERIAFILEDAGCTHVLTETRLAFQIPSSSSRPFTLVTLDTDLPAVTGQADVNPRISVEAQNAAYVIYTSGSTGRPKGVVVTHANVMRLMAATEDWFSFAPSDVWSLFHSYAFDFSVWELWGALLYGGRVVVVPYWVSRSPEEFYGLLLREGVTVLNQTPSAFRQLMRAEERLAAETGAEMATPPALRFVVFGGEALEPSSLRPWYERHGDERPRLINMYGITETTVHVTHRILSRADIAGARVSVIGRGIPDLRLYVLDGRMQPVPTGVVGELYVGGAGLARGYLDQPSLTAERFTPDPFSSEAGTRLYRTGDVVRLSGKGELEYLGRADEQLKVRGFRIEPGEVEAALLSHDSVRGAVVVARDEGGDRRLVAYVVGAPGATVPSASVMREHLRQTLPEYMVPSAFVTLDSLPLTSNGKVDRRALPAPPREQTGGEYVAPRTEAERALAAVWQEVLGAGRAGVEDNFFDLGGDPILNVRVVALARKRGFNFSVEQLFRHQTIAELVRHIGANNGDQRRRADGEDVTQAAGPFSLISHEDRMRMPGGVEDAYPLSMLQAGMLFHSDLNRELALYHNYTSFHLRAPFDARALELALRRLIEHHPVLRTSFDLSGYSVPLQLVHRNVEPPLEVEDLRGMAATEQDEVMTRWQDEERQRKIDWSQAPLLRFHVHLRAEDTFQFSFAEHHAILDGWSVATMLAELFRTYFSLLGGAEETEEPPPSSLYRDFVALEQKALTSAEAERFWRQWLTGSSIITLPRLHTQEQPERPASTEMINVPISAELSEGLKHAAHAAGVPIKSVLLAAHLRVLSQLGGQDDVVTGMVSHGRPEAEDAERALGLYLNTLPFRLRLRGGTWMELAQQAFAGEVDSMPFRYYPMAQVKIDQGGRGLFETAFNFTHFHVLDAVHRSDTELLDVAAFVRTEFALTADFALKGPDSNVHLTLIENGEALTREQLDSIGGYYTTALTAIANDPSARYDLTSLLSDEERQRLIVDWNDTQADYPRELCIHQVFEQEAQLRPDAVAVESLDQQLSYAELNRRADALALALRRHGVGPDILVGVMLERSVDLIVALLAVNKAGGAYVPLNLSDPPGRIRYIVEDAGAPVVLTNRKFAEGPAVEALAAVAVGVVYVDADEHLRLLDVDEALGSPAVAATPDNLAYMLYTSGSTGRPKGVTVTHRGVVSLLRSEQQVDLGPDEVMLEFSPVSFDASTFEIWGALLNGGRLTVFPPVVPSLRELGEFVDQMQVTTFLLTPALFHQFVEVNTSGMRALRQMLSGGDVLSASSVERAAGLLERNPGSRVINVYGPTEITVMCCSYIVGADRPAGTVPIGGPISNTQVYIVNGSHPAGIGEPGEIYIGGAGLARGYHKQPELTAERFVPDPFAARPGGRLYRTGDTGRHLSKGVIQFIGRLDQQVKISGFRIEPGEIETALESHPSVGTAVVVTDEETPGDKRLIAYVLAKEDAPTLAVDELRAYVKERVPEYMTPSAFVVLETLPLTPHGKVDRHALSALRKSAGRSDGKYIAPRDSIQRQLVVIWEELLQTSPIGVRDNFFESGGHSLLLMMLVARIEERLGERVAMADVFNGPTIEHLSELVRERGRHTLSSVIVPMQTAGTRPPLFGLHPGSDEVWRYTELVRRLGMDQPFYGVQARRVEAGLVAHTEIEAMASDYVEALIEFHPGGPYLLCGWSMGGVIAFEVARQLMARGERVALLALIDAKVQSTRRGEHSWFMLLVILALDLGLPDDKLIGLMQEMKNLPPPGQLRRVWSETKRVGVVPPEMTLLEFRRLFDTFKANANMMLRYEAGNYEGRITLIAAEQNFEQTIPGPWSQWSENEASPDPLMGWGRLATGGIDRHTVPGNHFTMMKEPFVEALAERLRACVDEALRTSDFYSDLSAVNGSTFVARLAGK